MLTLLLLGLLMPTQVMTPVARDDFTGTDSSGFRQSGSAPFSLVDGFTSTMLVNSGGNQQTGDQFDYITHFPTGDITVRLVWTDPTHLQCRRISTIAGNTFNVLGFTATNPAQFPTAGTTVTLQLQITRGAANNQTNYTVNWFFQGTSNFTFTQSFTTTGEQTPTGADYALTGTNSFIQHTDMLPRSLNGGGQTALAVGSWRNVGYPTGLGQTNGILPGIAIASNDAIALQRVPSAGGNYVVDGVTLGACGQGIEATIQLHNQPSPNLGYILFFLNYTNPNRTGYLLRIAYGFTTLGGPTVAYGLSYYNPANTAFITNGVAMSGTAPVPVALDTDILIQFVHQGDLLIARANGAPVLTFNLATDHPSALPASLAPVYHDGTVGLQIKYPQTVRDFTVLTEETIPDDSGVITGTQNSGAGAWPVDRQGRWSQGLPSPVDRQGRVIPVQAAWVCDRATGLWVPVSGADTRDDTGDTGDGEPTLGCVDPTPVIISNPDPVDPITGRFFGISNIALSLLGDLFTGTQIPIAQLTTTNLGIAFAAGATLIGGPGGYDKMKSGGVYSPAAFNNWIDTDVAPNLARYLSATADGSLFGLSLYDDFGSTGIFPPHGISQSDLLAGLNHARAALPGVRLGVRGLPSQFPADLGWDFYTAQYVSWRGTPSAFRAKEQPIAIARSAYIIISMNYLGGGDGSSGIRTLDGTELSRKRDTYEMSAAEVVTYGAGLYTDGTNLAGAIGYQYSPTFLSRPGMIAAFTINHNRIAAL